MQTRRLTLVEVAAWTDDERECLRVSDLELSTSDRRRTAAVWLWLCDVSPTSKEVARVGNEVLADAGLIVALNLPASEFFAWFRGAAWSDFDSTARTGSETWAWVVLHRTWEACQALGMMALQCPVSVSRGSV
jgi:hypothetical protein